MVLSLALVFSCTKVGLDTINEITDHSNVPEGAVEMAAPSATSTWSTDRRYFDLSFGSDLTTTLVGYDALLTPGQYVLGADQIGNAILSKTKVGGAAAQTGFVTVSKKGNEYRINAKIDDKVLTWKGTLPFTEDPAPVLLSEVQSTQKNEGLITMQLATPGISKGYNEQWQEVWTGEGGYLAIDLYSEDGYLHEGVYTPCAEGGKVNAGEFGIGYDTTVDWGWGPMEFKDWGTCWWEVANGTATATKITDGIITVTSREEKVDGKDVTIWTIFWGKDYPKEILFDGAIKELTKPKTPSGPVSFDCTYTIGDPVQCTTQAGEVVDGVLKYPFTFVDASGKEVAYLEFILADGSDDVEEGDYVSTEYAHEAGQLANGYFLDFGEWGTFAGGSYYIDGAGEKVYINSGVTVSVSKIATGAFKFSSEGFEFTAAGPNYVAEGGGGETGPVYAMTDTVAADCTDAAGVAYPDVESHTLVMKDDSDQFVAQIKLIRTAGTTDLAGTYTVAEYAHEDFSAGNGFDLGVYFGMDPGAYVIGSYYVSDGEVVIIEPGETITVTSAGNNSWKFVGSTGYTFVGQL